MAYTLQYYDLVLGGIIGALGVGVAVGAFTALAMPFALVLLGGVSMAFMAHAMFVNGPIDEFEDLTEEVEEAPMDTDAVPAGD